MATEDNDATEDEGWTEIDGAGPASAAGKEDIIQDEPDVFELKVTAPAKRMCLYTAGASAVMAFMLITFPEFREVRITDATVLVTGYFLLPIPIMAFIWAGIYIGQKENKGKPQPAITSILLSAVSAGFLIYATILGPGLDNSDASASDRTLEMTGEELEAWRKSKLSR
jgi:hypothetical protein